MLDFVKKLFGLNTRPDVHPLDGATRQAQEAPYKIEPQLDSTKNVIKVDVGSMAPAQAVQAVEKVQEKVKKATKPKKAKVEPEVVAAKPSKPKKPKAKKSS